MSKSMKDKRTSLNVLLKNNKKEIKYYYNDSELNELNYKDAILFDRRTLCQYYFSLLKAKNIIIFSFCPIKDYNSIIIKSCIFCLSFSVFYAVNFAFFNDEMIHKIYKDEGKYDIKYFLPIISISFAVSHVITIIIKIIFLSGRNIIKLKTELKSSLVNEYSYSIKRNICIKYTIFFISGLIFLIFFWMLLSSFGAVYQNTQIYIFENTLMSFAIDLFYPFIFNIFPCICRTSALGSKNNECIFNLSKFLQLI